MNLLQRLNTKATHYANLVRLEHTVFALPFAMTALLLANPSPEFPSLHTVAWVTLAMIGGRTYAMGLNRLADAHLDALNPRTASREIPAGLVSKTEAWLLTLGALSLMIFAVWQLPLLCQQLLPVAVLILTLYSYTKRFTSLCHLVLGLALGCSAIGGWLAQSGSWQGGLPLLFGAAVALWVMGFDVIYACQDADFDQKHGLFSLPAQWGVETALHLSRWMHGASILALLLFIGFYSRSSYGFVGWGFCLATVLMGLWLVKEHRLVHAEDLTRVNQAFFTLNGQISVGFLGLVLVERVIRFIIS
jgi:4-hydroxybenzoate polyprenyltransferase